jgi:sarcosine oxidase subunit delta
MRINCPFCGERDLQEFVYHGDAGARRPAVAAAASPEDERRKYVETIHFLDNPAGAHKGFWHHRAGCRRWLTIVRDTRSHAILSVALTAQDATE